MTLRHFLQEATVIFFATVSLSNVAFCQSTREQRLQNHLYYFASDSLQGREAGSIYSAKAAEYIINEYEQIGVTPFFESGWKMPFQKSQYPDRNFFDVVGIIKGTDPVLCKELIVLGAHFDHLGTKEDGTVYNGADDNASGSSALIEIARQLKENQSSLKRSVVIAAFDGEELGLYGSYALAKVLKEDGLIDNVKVMMSIDMVGWLKDGALKIEGVGTIKNGKEIVSEYAGKDALNVNIKRFEREILTATDTQGFAELGVPTLDMCTGLKSPYHKPEDDAELIDYKGLDKISGFVADVTQEIASDENFSSTGKVAPKHRLRPNTFQIAPRIGIGTGHMTFPKSRMTTGRALEYEGGLSLKINSGSFAFMVSGLYESSSSGFPIEDEIFSDKGKYTQTSITVPGYIMLQSNDPMSKLFFGAGPVYRHILDYKYSDKVISEYDVKENQWGYGFIFGVSLGPYCISGEFRNSANSIFSDKSIKGKLCTYTMGLSYWF